MSDELTKLKHAFIDDMLALGPGEEVHYNDDEFNVIRDTEQTNHFTVWHNGEHYHFENEDIAAEFLLDNGAEPDADEDESGDPGSWSDVT
jgi:hypothetical protein